jgi:hypothetical protein
MLQKKGQAALELRSGATARRGYCPAGQTIAPLFARQKDGLHGQAALDFLLTYGWALALVGIVVAVFFMFGIFDISNFMGSKAVGFSEVAVKDWRMDTDGTFTIMLTSHSAHGINITNVSIAIENRTACINTKVGVLAIGQSSNRVSTASGAFNGQPAGTGYMAKVEIGFINMDSGFAQSSTGTLVGKVI